MSNALKKLISLKDISLGTKLIQASKILFLKPLYTQWKVRSLSQKYLDQQLSKSRHYIQANQTFQLFNLSEKKALTEWATISDKQIGGQSEAQLYFDQSLPNQKSCRVKGTVNTSDRNKLVKIPFIGITQRHSFGLKVHCFQSIQIHLKSDGHPIHVDLIIRTIHQGHQLVSGRIVSKSTDWHIYQLPFINMRYQDSVMDQHQQFKQFVLQQLIRPADLTLNCVTLRLLDSVERERDVSIKSIKLVRRIGLNNFSKQYVSPYFYIVKDKDQLGIKENQYQSMKQIDTGDKIFIRKQNK